MDRIERVIARDRLHRDLPAKSRGPRAAGAPHHPHSPAPERLDERVATWKDEPRMEIGAPWGWVCHVAEYNERVKAREGWCRRPLSGGGVALVLLFASACVHVLGIDDLEKVSADPPIVAGSAPPDAPDVAVVDTSAPDVVPDTVAQDAPPGMVRVGAAKPFFVDATEVTWAAYLTFTASVPIKNRSVPGSTRLCNLDHTPSVPPPPVDQRATMPVVGVDWCDARAYCQSVKKRLCGPLGGGVATSGSPVGSELHAACAYPSPPPQAACFEPDGGVKPVGSRPGCVGGAPAVYDLLGNVEEWGDGIFEGYPPAFGGFSGGSPFRCDTPHGAIPESRTATLGFRCCADVP